MLAEGCHSPPRRSLPDTHTLLTERFVRGVRERCVCACCQWHKEPALGFCENSAQLEAAGVTATYSGAINQAVSLGHARPVSLLHTPLALNFLPQKSVTQHALSGRRQRIGLGVNKEKTSWA